MMAGSATVLMSQLSCMYKFVIALPQVSNFLPVVIKWCWAQPVGHQAAYILLYLDNTTVEKRDIETFCPDNTYINDGPGIFQLFLLKPIIGQQPGKQEKTSPIQITHCYSMINKECAGRRALYPHSASQASCDVAMGALQPLHICLQAAYEDTYENIFMDPDQFS